MHQLNARAFNRKNRNKSSEKKKYAVVLSDATAADAFFPCGVALHKCGEPWTVRQGRGAVEGCRMGDAGEKDAANGAFGYAADAVAARTVVACLIG